MAELQDEMSAIDPAERNIPLILRASENTEQKAKKVAASIPELAVEYGVSESLLYSLANQNRLPGCRRLGKRFLVHRATFEQWLADGHGE